MKGVSHRYEGSVTDHEGGREIVRDSDRECDSRVSDGDRE